MYGEDEFGAAAALDGRHRLNKAQAVAIFNELVMREYEQMTAGA